MKIILAPRWLFALLATGIASILLLAFATNIFVLEWQNIRSSDTRTLEIANTSGRITPLDRRIVPLFPPSAPDTVPPNITADQRSRIESLLQAIKDAHGVTVRVFDPSLLTSLYGLHGQSYPASQIERNLANLDQWLFKYPRSYLDTIGLRTIHLYNNWEYQGVRTAGFLIDSQSIAMDSEERVLHHELWHLADAKVFGDAGDNAAWLRAKNAADASAGSMGKNPLDVIGSKLYLEDRPEGYASAYGAEAGPDEDQATIAEMLFTDISLLQMWADHEPALARGIAYLESFYEKESGGLMNDREWADLAHGVRIDASYWRKS